MSETQKIEPSIDAQLLAYMNGPPPQDKHGVDLSLIRAGLAMSIEERVERHHQARLFAERMMEMGRAARGQLRETSTAVG